ncbi:putative reverse transcriptase domain-containing protein, partial [Tanacetum coccineum]
VESSSDYECEIKYHSGKANVVANALSRKARLKPRRVRAMSITIHFGLKTKILEARGEASKDLKAPAKWLRGLETHFERRDDGGIYFFYRIWIPSVGGVRKLNMDEGHTSRYSIHPGADKMYYDLRDLYWWLGMKREVAEYIKKRLKTARSHQKTYADKRHKPLEFKVRDRVLLKASPWKGVLKLPQDLSCIHDTFHVSNHKKCLAEPDAQVPLEVVEIHEHLRFVENLIEIVGRDVKKLKRRRIPLVKVCCNYRQGAEYTWEQRDVKKLKRRRIPLVKVHWNSRQGAEYTLGNMKTNSRKKYQHLFSETVPPSRVQPEP